MASLVFAITKTGGLNFFASFIGLGCALAERLQGRTIHVRFARPEGILVMLGVW